MSKKIIFPLIVILILVVTAGGFFWWQGQKGYGFVSGIWNIKSTISQISSFGPAAIVQPPSPPPSAADQTTGQAGQAAEPFQEKATEGQTSEKLTEDSPLQEYPEDGPREISLAEFQETLDDIAEKIDILSAEMSKLAKEKIVTEKEKTEEEKEEKEKKEKKEIEKKEEICRSNSINVNTALASELEKITGIGPIIAQRIIAGRPFSSLNDLLKVKGIGEKTLQKITSQGCIYIDEFYSRFSGSAIGGAGSAGNAAAAAAAAPESSFYPKIIISEIQISPIGQRFIELYNPNEQEINLTNWYIQRKTASALNWDSFITSTKFEGKIIPAKTYFLIASSTEADIVMSLTLTDSNSLVLKNPNREIVDLVGWTEALEYESAPATSSPTDKSLGRKYSTTTQSYIDTDNNSTDFEIQNSTPGAQNQNLDQQKQNQLPVASFTFSPENPFVDVQILFDASLSEDFDGQIISYIWDFGDNGSTTTNLATTTYRFTRSGNFLITLLVVDNLGTTSTAATTTIIVSMSEPATNLLLNEFFEEWSNGTSAVPSDYWVWDGTASRIRQSSDGLVGNYSVELTLTTSDYKGFYQQGITMSSSATYYAEIWLKGIGIVKLGIKYPNSDYVYYSDETIINTTEWATTTVFRQPANSGGNGGIKLNVKYDSFQGIPSGSKLFVGAAWLGAGPPPENWPKGWLLNP